MNDVLLLLQCGTLCKGAEILKRHGARKVIGIVTHGVLSGDALQRLNSCDALELLVVTNTIPQQENLARCSKAPYSNIIVNLSHSVQNVLGTL